MRRIVVHWIILAIATLSMVSPRADREVAPGVLPPVLLPGGTLLFGDAAPRTVRKFQLESAVPAGGRGGAVPALWQLIQLPGDDPKDFMRPGATMTGMQMGVRLLSSDVECDEPMMTGPHPPPAPRSDCEFDPGDDRVLPDSCR